MSEIMLYSPTVKVLRGLYDIVSKYYEFDYSLIDVELNSAFSKTKHHFEYQKNLSKTGQLDHLPDDLEINIYMKNVIELHQLREKYLSIDDALFDLLAFSLHFIPRLIDNSVNEEALDIDIEYDIIMNDEKCRVYEFLLDNFRNFKEKNRAKARMTIFYGIDSQIEIDNYNNWLYNLIRKELHKELTFDGTFEYERRIESEKPSRAPSFGNFVAYNTYCLLMDMVGAKKKFPVEFLNFIIDFCSLCKIKLLPRQMETVGMKEFLSHAKKQYKDKPMPFSLVRY